MKNLLLLLAVVILQDGASAQTATSTRTQPPLTASEVKWGGKEWFRYKLHSRKKLLPGESRLLEKAAMATLGWPPRDELADKSVVITEIKYSDGPVWRQK